MLSMPLAYASTLDRHEPSYVEAFWSPSLGVSLVIGQANAYAIVPALFHAAARRGVFLSQTGPRVLPMSSSSWASPLASGLCLLKRQMCPETTKATRLGRPRCRLEC